MHPTSVPVIGLPVRTPEGVAAGHVGAPIAVTQALTVGSVVPASAATFAVLPQHDMDAIRKHVRALHQWLACMSYNDSYFGEPPGLLKREVAALARLVDGGAALPASQSGPVDEEAIEAAFWIFDARVKGTGQWAGRAQCERDAFKSVVRGLLARA